jgi:hypothetical protein
MRKESLLLLVALLPNSGGDAAKADRCGREHVAWLRGSNAALASPPTIAYTQKNHTCATKITHVPFSRVEKVYFL